MDFTPEIGTRWVEGVVRKRISDGSALVRSNMLPKFS